MRKQRTVKDRLDEFQLQYNETGWPWPTVASPSSEDAIARLRHESQVVQQDACGRLDLGSPQTALVGSGPASYTLEELKAMVVPGSLTYPMCGKTLGQHGDLTKHLKSHGVKEGKFRCTLCGAYAGATEANLRNHIWREHPSQWEPRPIDQVPCPHCGYWLRYCNLGKHLTTQAQMYAMLGLCG